MTTMSCLYVNCDAPVIVLHQKFRRRPHIACSCFWRIEQMFLFRYISCLQKWRARNHFELVCISIWIQMHFANNKNKTTKSATAKKEVSITILGEYWESRTKNNTHRTSKKENIAKIQIRVQEHTELRDILEAKHDNHEMVCMNRASGLRASLTLSVSCRCSQIKSSRLYLSNMTVIQVSLN